MAKTRKPSRPQPPRKRRGGGRWGMLLVLLLAVPLALPTAMVVAVGMLPTAVAAIADRSATRSAALCVGGLNFAGTMPYLLAMWFGEHSIAAAMRTLGDVFVLLVMYGSAGMGWLLYLATPPVMATVLQVMAQQKIVSLRNRQRRLVDEWGEDVRGQPTRSKQEPSA